MHDTFIKLCRYIDVCNYGKEALNKLEISYKQNNKLCKNCIK